MVIFTMVAVSVLETMLVMFLMDFEGFSCFYKKAENCENAKTDVRLEPMEGNLFFEMWKWNYRPLVPMIWP